MSTDTITLDQIDSVAPEEAVTAAAAAVQDARRVQAQWEAKESAARAELESVQAQAAEALLEDPSAEEALATSITQLTARVEIVHRAAVAHRPRVAAAETAWLQAQAALFATAIPPLEDELRQHETKTARLLKQLEDHEGVYVPEADLRWALAPVDRPKSWKVPKSRPIHASLTLARRQHRILCELAAGVDPAPLLVEWRVGSEIYPECIMGPDALVPVPAFLQRVQQRVQQAQDVIVGLEQARDELPGRIADLERQEAQMQPREGKFVVLPQLRERLRAIDDEISAAREHLDALAPAPASVKD
ncbi:hypothetical protein NPS01_37760 [Nocardioides psychrotolerans]|uniref:Uncharacterized protein n=1 Tax=Nocardioides psychrotolerans TaxID=1005945 RepID=A0A1I3I6S6_9ACTN|nr:hypothetical protein [Nocardioides psychrotolerans]GEP40113.1 hypothetical protein NPS01_37760 [Nocardioides psychrotolerans]SFI43622.1 hypothetical protein SAMN05216561_108140 [Nocardioides psychrotolerans]